MRVKTSLLLGILLFLLTSLVLINCRKDNKVPQVTTAEVTEIGAFTARTGGVVISDQGNTVIERGVCWAVTQNPTIENSRTFDGAGGGSFLSVMTGLTPNTTYYVRAYATNIEGTGYGVTMTFKTTTADLPELTTKSITDITSVSACSGGDIITDHGQEVTTEGVCWSTSTNPTVTEEKTVISGSSNDFISCMSGLSANTTYYVRAYATSSNGTGYGNTVSFKTLAADEITDFEGNIYKTIQIGTQVWMSENLKATKFNDGTDITKVEGNSDWNTTITPAYCFYNNDESSNKEVYGAIYNFYAVASNKLCPAGYHVAGDDEFKTLEMYLGMTSVQANSSDFRGTDEGGKMKENGYSHWNSPNTGATNSSGFTALPGGFRHVSGSFMELGTAAHYWTSTSYNSSQAWCRNLQYDKSTVKRTNYVNKIDGKSVRCIKD